MSMQKDFSVELHKTIPSKFSSANEAIAVGIFADEPHVAGTETLDKQLRALCEQVIADGEFLGEEGTSLLIRTAGAEEEKSAGRAMRRILLVGLGAHADFDESSVRHAAGMAARAARQANLRTLNLFLPQSGNGRSRKQTRAAAEGAYLGLYDNSFYQKEDEDAPALERLNIITEGGAEDFSEELERARVIAESVNWTRSLADEPGLSLPPREFARRAAEMAGEFGLRVESLDAEEIRARGMGALLGVAQGSDEQPALIVVRYEPEGASETDELYAFVGKGITFDTGGISLKHGLDMWEMKTDMAGGAAVLGAMRAIAQFKPLAASSPLCLQLRTCLRASAIKARRHRANARGLHD